MEKSVPSRKGKRGWVGGIRWFAQSVSCLPPTETKGVNSKKKKKEIRKIRTRNKPIGGDACCSRIPPVQFSGIGFLMVCIYTVKYIYITEASLSSPASARHEKKKKNRTFWRFFFSFARFSLSLSLDDRWEELQTERAWLLLNLPLSPFSYSFL